MKNDAIYGGSLLSANGDFYETVSVARIREKVKLKRFSLCGGCDFNEACGEYAYRTEGCKIPDTAPRCVKNRNWGQEEFIYKKLAPDVPETEIITTSKNRFEFVGETPPPKGTFYLASPYSSPCKNTEAKRAKIAELATIELLEMDYNVFSPIAYSHDMAAFNGNGCFETWKKFDFAMLDSLDALIVLMISGYTESKGLRAEMKRAANGKNPKPIYFLRVAE